ncbi:MAG: DUF4230 domain-containing protein [Flavobacteriales bacterium]|nr:DUF4230 domain-containing protein [Flavobacteriales bacterium]MBP7156851.1 DUF4230 domain-containing protein [Flavobacteriales bacterium]HQW41621.1 DUF4230 domain-containing protein [Flavobacteriales bacterium]
MDKLKGLIFMVVAGLLVFFITRSVYEPEPATEQVNATVLLERVRPVLKLITVEGDFNEVYSYQSAEALFSWLKDLSPFQKKAMLRLQAKVSVGYDLEGMHLEVDEATHTVHVNGLTKPTILSIDHEVDYYDLDAGTFNPFTAADLTRMEADAKAQIRTKALQSDLFERAEEQRGAMFNVIRTMVESAGWKFDDGTTPVDGRNRLKS